MATWLDEHHDRMTTPPDVIRRALGEAGFERETELRRLVVGQSNEVYEAGPLIVRISHRPHGRFAREAAIIERVGALGLPVPEVLAIAPIEADGGGTELMVQGRLAGGMLVEAPDPTAHVVALAEALVVVHQLPTDGFGPLDADLRGTHERYDGWFVDPILDGQLSATHAVVASDDALLHDALDATARELDEGRAFLASQPARLAWGDCGSRNVLVDGGRLTGLLDWEGAKGAPPENDLGWWACSSDDVIPTADLVAAYRAAGGTVDDRMLRLVVLRVELFLVAHTVAVGDVEGARRHRTRLLDALRGSPDP